MVRARARGIRSPGRARSTATSTTGAEGDAPREALDEIVQHANQYSPVANSMRNPIPFEIGLA